MMISRIVIFSYVVMVIVITILDLALVFSVVRLKGLLDLPSSPHRNAFSSVVGVYNTNNNKYVTVFGAFFV